MSDFLSREKEFLKLNEELDKKAKSALEKKIESSRAISPKSAAAQRVLANRRASIEVDKFNLKTNSRVSGARNSTLPRPECKRNRGTQSPPNPRLSPNSRIRIDKANQITSQVQPSSQVLSPKIENRKLSSSKYNEKPPVKPRIMSQTKANTVPRHSRDLINSSRCIVKERELISINSKINKFERRAKMDLEYTKENIEKSKIKEKSPSREVQSPKSVVSPKSIRGSVKSPTASGKQSPTSLSSRRSPKMITETYRNKNFKESPSTEALHIRLNSPTNEIKDHSSARSELTGRAKRESATSSIKKPLRQLPATAEKVNKKNVSTDGLIKYLKSKLSIIEMELEDNMSELKKKSDELHASYETQKKLEIQRDQAISKNNALTDQLSKMEEKYTTTDRKLKDKETEFAATVREVESLRREVRVVTQANVNLEKRLYRANEELENVKNHLASMKEGERELKESTRQEREAQDRQIKTLKKQRSELLTAYKKQLYLIDNLRRQNICMEQARMISFGEKEFTKVLEWNMQN